MSDPLALTDRTIVVIGGGGGGIGSAISLTCAGAGATVVAVSNVEADVTGTERAIADAGGTCIGRVVDITDDAAVSSLFDELDSLTTPPHGLVNVVGGTGADDWNPLERQSLDAFDRLMATNLRYALATSGSAASRMIEHGVPGSIVNISSASVVSAGFHGVYGAAKAGLEALTRTMAVEWGRHGIRANCLALGTVATPKSGTGGSDELAEAAIPLRRRGQPQEIANAALFLLSDMASYISGQTIAVDGGATVKLAIHGENGLPIFVTNPAFLDRLR